MYDSCKWLSPSFHLSRSLLSSCKVPRFRRRSRPLLTCHLLTADPYPIERVSTCVSHSPFPSIAESTALESRFFFFRLFFGTIISNYCNLTKSARPYLSTTFSHIGISGLIELLTCTGNLVMCVAFVMPAVPPRRDGTPLVTIGS